MRKGQCTQAKFIYLITKKQWYHLYTNVCSQTFRLLLGSLGTAEILIY